MYIYLKKYKTYRKDTTMSIKADFHLHSNFSGDSYTPMKDMIESAITRGLTHMCITEHYDPDYVYIPGEEGMFELNIDSIMKKLTKSLHTDYEKGWITALKFVVICEYMNDYDDDEI